MVIVVSDSKLSFWIARFLFSNKKKKNYNNQVLTNFYLADMKQLIFETFKHCKNLKN